MAVPVMVVALERVPPVIRMVLSVRVPTVAVSATFTSVECTVATFPVVAVTIPPVILALPLASFTSTADKVPLVVVRLFDATVRFPDVMLVTVSPVVVIDTSLIVVPAAN